MRKREEDMSLDNTPQGMPDEVDPAYGGLLGEPPAEPYVPLELQLPKNDPWAEETEPDAPMSISASSEDIKWRRHRALELAIEILKLQPAPAEAFDANDVVTEAEVLSAFVEDD